MNLNQMMNRVQELEQELSEYAESHQEELKQTLKKSRVKFERAVIQQHRKFKKSVITYLAESGILSVLSAPFIYALIIPLVLLDIFVSIYHAICFPIYGIEKVQRWEYISIDRQHLAYLNWIEKLNCAYCGYANGLLAYVRAIAGHTEAHWCPIKHARRTKGQHPVYWHFAEYGDPESFRKTEAEVTAKARESRVRLWSGQQITDKDETKE